MAAESLTQPQSLEFHLVTLFEKLDELRRDQLSLRRAPRPPMQTEIRTLEFWRAIISECTSAFLYVLLVCGAAIAGAVRATGVGVTGNAALAPPTATIAAALASGFAMAALTQCFGAHVNPALSIAATLARHISPLRGIMFVIAQCGGGIAGAALLFGVAVPGFQGNATAATALPARNIAPWERFGLEMVLSIVVILSYMINMDTYRKYLGSAALNIGAAYCCCTLVMMPCLNPARALGPAFVLNMWENHWVYWFGPILGGALAAPIYEFLYNPRRHQRLASESIDGDSSSIQSEDDPYDDLDKPVGGTKFHGASSTFNTYRATTSAAPNSPPGGYSSSLTAASLYSAPPCKLERVESLYAGSKSLYAKSPPLTRANLNRSQSVYTKTQHQPIQPRAGPLVPAQSLYPMRFNSTTNPNAQNAQNAQQSLLRSESVYGVRGAVNPRGVEGGGVYGNAVASVCQPPPPSSITSGSSSQSHQPPKFTRPESMYGMLTGRGERNRQESAGDSTYGSYQSSRNYQSNDNYQNQMKNQQQQQQQQQQQLQQKQQQQQPSNSITSVGVSKGANVQPPPPRPQPEQQPQPPPHYASRGQHSIINTANSVASYHHSKQHSPNPQY